MVGLTSNRSVQDEKLIEAIFQTHYAPESRATSGPIYGATCTNLIIDARPTTNAMANTAKGAGTENMDHYKDAKKAYLGIDHIHVMRESLGKVVEALRETEVISPAALGASDERVGDGIIAPILDRNALRRSGWLKHISAIMEGTLLIVRNVHVNSSHVLIHCSDGWDRTAQLSALSQLCLDPFYRTIRGFQILIEKDWVSFGHKFLDRCGHLSSEKFFLVPVENTSSGGGAEAAQAFLASVQNRFTSQNHIKETSPVFHQWLECVRQVQRQFPERFEFNERFLRQLHYHLYSCQFGTFLFNSERERRVGEGGPPACDRTVSVWDFFNSQPEISLNSNPSYDPSLDDPTSRAPKADMGVLMPNPKDVRFWHELYGRTDEDMNGKFVVRQLIQEPEFVGAIEGSAEDPVSSHGTIPSSVPLPPSPAISPSLSIPAPQSFARWTMERSNSPSSQASPLSTVNLSPDAQRTRHDSMRGFDPAMSSPIQARKSTLPPRTPSPAAQPPLPSRSLGGAQVTDLFSSSGVRSMWGRFSSNASAALSVVQDAAKDLKGLSLNAGNTEATPGGELKSREEIGVWGEEPQHERRPSSPRGPGAPYTIGPSAANPWSTTKARPNMPSMFLENPWNTPSDPVPDPHSLSVEPLSGVTSTLPADPTVALPNASRPPISSPGNISFTGSISPGPSARTNPLPSPPSEPANPTPAAAPASSDPLGVGLL